jgi:hypothetical protein
VQDLCHNLLCGEFFENANRLLLTQIMRYVYNPSSNLVVAGPKVTQLNIQSTIYEYTYHLNRVHLRDPTLIFGLFRTKKQVVGHKNDKAGKLLLKHQTDSCRDIMVASPPAQRWFSLAPRASIQQQQQQHHPFFFPRHQSPYYHFLIAVVPVVVMMIMCERVEDDLVEEDTNCHHSRRRRRRRRRLNLLAPDKEVEKTYTVPFIGRSMK